MLTFENVFLELNLNLLREEVCTWQHKVLKIAPIQMGYGYILLNTHFFLL